MDQIKGMLDTLTELSEEQLTELQSMIVGEFEAVEKEDPTPQTVDTMTSLADALDTVRGETKRREAQAQELTSRAAEAAMRVKGQEDDSDTEDEEMEAAMDSESPKESPEEAPAEKVEVETEDESSAAQEAPEEEAPVAEEAPEDEEEKKKKMMMAEASTATDEGSELSTEEATTETEIAAEAAVVEVEQTSTDAEPAQAEFSTEEAVVEAPAEATAEISGDAPAEASTSTEETAALEEQKEQEAPVTAAASTEETSVEIEVPADRRPVSKASAATVAITAGADIPGYTAGSSVESMSEVAELMSKRLHALRRVNGGDGEQHIVASVSTEFPESRTLSSDAESNWEKIRAVTSPEAIVASGGHVAPFESKYDIFGIGTTGRPVRDALARFQADRGGIRFVTPPVLSSYGNAVGIWTNATDTNPGTDVKASLTVTAAAENTVATDAVTLQMQFGNLATRAYPELIARHNELGLIQHSREAEQYLLGKIGDASTAVTTTSLVGFGRDFLVQIGRAAAAYRSRHRMEADAPLRAIVPAWVKDAMAADLAIAMPGDNTINAYAEIDGYVASRNVNLTASLDQDVFGAQTTGAMNEFADSFSWYLFAEGSFLFLDGGTLDLGIIRDSSLVGTNDYKMFVETFEGIAKVGIESIKVTSTISVNGVAAALRDTTGGATAAAIEY